MVKKNLKVSLLLMDLVVLIVIFFSIYLVFDLVIKKILIIYNIDKFYESIRTTQFDLSNSIAYIEEKKELPYKNFIDEILIYVKLSTLKRSKYDNSLVAIIFPKEMNYLVIGEKNEVDFKIDHKLVDYDFFINEINKNNKEVIINNTGDLAPNTEKKDYVIFNLKGKQYIGIAKIAETGIRKYFDRNNNELVKPIIVIADRDDEFFFLINRIRNIFLILLAVVFGVGAIFKIYNTMIITREIYGIRDNMMSVINDIKEKGMISAQIKTIITKFIETSNLDESFTGLVSSLRDLGDIISGISDKDLFIATLKKDNSLLNPHDEMMTIMFLDIQGFTSITEKHKENIIDIINHIWTEVENIVEKNNGKINKLIGDAALIIFRENINDKKVNSCINALFSTLELLTRVPKICSDLNIESNFRIGLDYGKVTYGKSGTDKKYELGVIGDTVNTASRLEQVCKQYHTNLLITENVIQNLNLDINKEYEISKEIKYENQFKIKFFRVDKARPKGKIEAKQIFSVLINKDQEYSFIGSTKYFRKENCEKYNELLDLFISSIKPWREYINNKSQNSGIQLNENTKILKGKAEKNWSDIAVKFADFYFKTDFPPAEHFIRTILKFEEYDFFKKYPVEWFKKDLHAVKEPSNDWIELGTIELEK